MYLDLDELKLEQVGTGGVNEHGREELCIWLHLKKKHTQTLLTTCTFSLQQRPQHIQILVVHQVLNFKNGSSYRQL